MVRLRMMTLCTPVPRKKPPFLIRPDLPTPMIVLFDVTGISKPNSGTVMVVPTRMTKAELDVAYLSRSGYVVTVTVCPAAPPVVPPLVEANPSAVLDQVRPLPVVGADVAPLTKLK